MCIYVSTFIWILNYLEINEIAFENKYTLILGIKLMHIHGYKYAHISINIRI